MRIYMSGTVTNKNAHLIPTEIFLEAPNCDDNLSPSKDCIMLTGKECECSQEGNEWSSRWKGVELCNETDYEEDFTKDFLLNLIKERNLTLGNMNAYINFSQKEEFVKVESLYIMDSMDAYDKGTYLDEKLLTKEISFID